MTSDVFTNQESTWTDYIVYCTTLVVRGNLVKNYIVLIRKKFPRNKTIVIVHSIHNASRNL